MALQMQRGEVSRRIREGLRILGVDCEIPQMRQWLKKTYNTDKCVESTFYNLRTQYRGELELQRKAEQEAKVDVPPQQPANPQPAPPNDEYDRYFKEAATAPSVGGGGKQQEAVSDRQESDVQDRASAAVPNRGDVNGEKLPVEQAAGQVNDAPADDLIKASDMIEILPQLRAVLGRLGGRKGVAKHLIDAL
jgi:hypothetical protein